MMKRKLLATLGLTAAGLLVVPGLAAAQTDDDPTAAGRGWLAAKGSGEVEIDMGGAFRARVDGDVTITDNAGDMRFEVAGVPDRSAEAHEPGSEIELEDFRGAIHVLGSNLSISIEGQVALQAHGHGRAWLEGNGIYRGRYSEWKAWDGMVELGGAEVELAAA